MVSRKIAAGLLGSIIANNLKINRKTIQYHINKLIDLKYISILYI